MRCGAIWSADPDARAFTSSRECFGWLAAGFTVFVIAAPNRWQRFANSYWDAEPAQLWTHSLVKVTFGVFLCWLALFVL